MSDSLERLYQAVIAAKDLDPQPREPPGCFSAVPPDAKNWPRKPSKS